MPTAKKLPSGSWRCQVFSHSEPICDPSGTPVIDPKTGRQKQKRIYESFTCDDPTTHGKRKAEALAAEFAERKSILFFRMKPITIAVMGFLFFSVFMRVCEIFAYQRNSDISVRKCCFRL